MAGPMSLEEQPNKAAADSRWADSGVAEGRKGAVGQGDPNAYEVDFRPEGRDSPGRHALGDRAAPMLMYSGWLDSQGRHHPFNDASYKQWLAAIGSQYPGRPVRGSDLNLSGGGTLSASGEARLTAGPGPAPGSINLAGSSRDLGPLPLRAGDWARAAGGVELRNGAASLHPGGEDGSAGHADLAHGQLDLSFGGHHADGAGAGTGPKAPSWLGKAAASVGLGRGVGQGLNNGWYNGWHSGWQAFGSKLPRWL